MAKVPAGEREKLQQAFAAFDSDGSGALSVNELANILSIGGRLSEENALKEAAEVITKYDTDGNGMLDVSPSPQPMGACCFVSTQCTLSLCALQIRRCCTSFLSSHHCVFRFREQIDEFIAWKANMPGGGAQSWSQGSSPPPSPPQDPEGGLEGGDGEAGDKMKKLVLMVTGCRDDVDGISAKKHLVNTYVASHKGNPDCDLLQVLCSLHKSKCVNVVPAKVFKTFSWKSPAGGYTPEIKESSNVRRITPRIYAVLSSMTFKYLR